jgi:protein-S-isoprenylcysteine O-methyltransferase Ste14
MRRLASVLLFVLFVLGVAVPVVGAIRLWPSPFTMSGAALAVFFVVYVVEKQAAMFFVMHRHYEPDIDEGFSTVFTGYAYAAVLYGVVFEAPIRNHPPDAITILAGVAVLFAVALRYRAVRCLGISRRQGGKLLFTGGPFALVRHPVYFGACLEAIAIPACFHAWWSLLPAVLAFIPLEILRALREEAMMRRRFGEAYVQYSERTPMLVPWRFPRRRKPDAA